MEKIRKVCGMLSIKNFLLLTVAGIVNAFGVVIFLAPVKLYDSGISGTAMLVSQLTPKWISLSLVLILLNIPIFLLGLKREGVVFTICAIYAVLIYSIVAWIITDILPVDVTIVSPVRFGGAMDGIDIIGVMFAKKLGLSLGSFVMAYNVILYIICGIVLDSWILPLYSVVTYAAASKTIDFFVEGFDRSKAAFIVTEHPKHVCEALSAAFENGITTIDAKGYYSNTDRTLVYFIVNRFQVGKMRNLVHSIDPYAYIAINDVADIFPATNLNDLKGETKLDDTGDSDDTE